MSLGIVALQLVDIMLPSFQLHLVTGLNWSLGWKMADEGDILLIQSYGFSYQIGRFPLSGDPYVAINVVALAVLFYLVLKLFDPLAPTPAPPSEPATPAT
jgi:hypothetical protein